MAKRFHLALAKHPLLGSDPKAALLEVWQSMDGEMFTFLAQVCVAVVAFRLCGDARWREVKHPGEPRTLLEGGLFILVRRR